MIEYENKEMNIEEKTEFSKQNSMLRVMIGMLTICIGSVVLGAVTIYVNDGNQDRKLAAHDARFIITPTREEVKLMDRLVLAEIKATKAVNKNTKDSLDRVATAIINNTKTISELQAKIKP